MRDLQPLRVKRQTLKTCVTMRLDYMLKIINTIQGSMFAGPIWLFDEKENLHFDLLHNKVQQVS